MRGAFLSGQDWSHAVRKIERMEKLTKEDVVNEIKPVFIQPDLDYQMPIRAPSDGLRGFFEEFDAVRRWGGLFIPVWHPFVTGRLARWSLVEQWLNDLVEQNNVWITTMANIAKHIRWLHQNKRYQPRIDTLPYYSEPVTN